MILFIVITILFYIVPTVIAYFKVRELYGTYWEPKDLDMLDIVGVFFPIVNIFYLLSLQQIISSNKGSKKFVEKFFRL